MERIWYYMKPDKSKYGPYSEGELVALIKQEILTKKDYIWMKDLKGWLKVENSIYAYYLPENQTILDLSILDDVAK